eukprot:1186037-Prorocentrum_minimum.AAC.4
MQCPTSGPVMQCPTSGPVPHQWSSDAVPHQWSMPHQWSSDAVPHQWCSGERCRSGFALPIAGWPLPDDEAAQVYSGAPLLPICISALAWIFLQVPSQTVCTAQNVVRFILFSSVNTREELSLALHPHMSSRPTCSSSATFFHGIVFHVSLAPTLRADILASWCTVRVGSQAQAA